MEATQALDGELALDGLATGVMVRSGSDRRIRAKPKQIALAHRKSGGRPEGAKGDGVYHGDMHLDCANYAGPTPPFRKIVRNRQDIETGQNFQDKWCTARKFA
jgi:hypothetical protein